MTDQVDKALDAVMSALPSDWEVSLALSRFRGGWYAVALHYSLGHTPRPETWFIEAPAYPGSLTTPVEALELLAARLREDR